MPLRSTAVGHPFDPITVQPDARWLMAFSAGVPDDRPELYATDAHLVAHPLFPVAAEWQQIVANRSLPEGMTPDEARRGIHIAHDLVVNRPLAADEEVSIAAHVAAVGRRRAGATQEMLFVATDNSGAVVWRTRFTTLFLGVELEGEPAATQLDWPATPEIATAEPIAERQSHVGLLDAHVYSECARIWNPIHTDVVASLAAGLPTPILHGTATLARAVSIIADLAGAQLSDVRRISGRFGSMVALGCTIDVRLLGVEGDSLTFDVLDQNRKHVISGGLLQLSR